ncbi:MAG: hypothetical protein FJ118_06205 [Deltaproteobacteria bacterium]|nr:hypothetical protein [Deltaproteobacteria bacterium]
MGRIHCIIAAFLLLSASWASAATFEALAESVAAPNPAPLLAKPGAVVKAEFKASVGERSDLTLESDALLSDESAGPARPQVLPKPAVAFKKKGSRAMAPPPDPAPRVAAQAKEPNDDLEMDLEKDLVISPPPAKTEEAPKVAPKPSVEIPVAPREDKVSDKKLKRPVPAPQVKQVAPVKTRPFSTSLSPIQKVRPVTSNPWLTPAGSPRPSACPVPPVTRITYPPQEPAIQQQASQAQERTYVRDGVTVKLAAPPQPAQPVPATYQGREESFVGSDLLNAAADIISLPFAFISSLF